MHWSPLLSTALMRWSLFFEYCDPAPIMPFEYCANVRAMLPEYCANVLVTCDHALITLFEKCACVLVMLFEYCGDVLVMLSDAVDKAMLSMVMGSLKTFATGDDDQGTALKYCFCLPSTALKY
jgi:hypothetical protein